MKITRYWNETNSMKLSQAPLLNIGHLPQKTGDSLKIDLSRGNPPREIESVHLHRHNFYMILLILGGCGEHIIDFEKFAIQPGRLFFLAPGQIHVLKTNRSTEYFTVQFTPGFVATHADQSIPFEGYNFLDISKEKTDGLSHLFKDLLKEKKAKNSNNTILNLYLAILLEKIKIEIGSQRTMPRKVNPVITRFMNLVEAYHTKGLSVRDYAEKLNVSANYLNILSKRETGISASSHIYGRVMLEAKRLIVYSDCSVSQIAYALNFCDTSYFIKRFKQETGQTPRDFKTHYYKMLYDR